MKRRKKKEGQIPAWLVSSFLYWFKNLHAWLWTWLHPTIYRRILYGNAKVKLSSRTLNYEPIDQLPYLFPEGHVNPRHPSSIIFTRQPSVQISACLKPSCLFRKNASVPLKPSLLIATGIWDILSSWKKKEIRLLHCFASFHYLNLEVQRPITSPWQTNSALNSDPSSVR